MPNRVLQKLMSLVSITRTPHNPAGIPAATPPVTPPATLPTERGHSRPRSHPTTPPKHGASRATDNERPKPSLRDQNTVNGNASVVGSSSDGSIHDDDEHNEDTMLAGNAYSDNAESSSVSIYSTSSGDKASESQVGAEAAESSEHSAEGSATEGSVVPPWKAASDAVATGAPLSINDAKTGSKADQNSSRATTHDKSKHHNRGSHREDRRGESSHRDSHRAEKFSHQRGASHTGRHQEDRGRSRGRGRHSGRFSRTEASDSDTSKTSRRPGDLNSNSNSNFTSRRRPFRDDDSSTRGLPDRRGRGRGAPGRDSRGGRGGPKTIGASTVREREEVPDVLAGSGGKFQISTADIVG